MQSEIPPFLSSFPKDERRINRFIVYLLDENQNYKFAYRQNEIFLLKGYIFDPFEVNLKYIFIWEVVPRLTCHISHLSGRVGWINELFKLWGLVPHFIYACPNSNPLKTKKVIHGLKNKCQFCVFPSKNEVKNQITWKVHQHFRHP